MLISKSSDWHRYVQTNQANANMVNTLIWQTTTPFKNGGWLPFVGTVWELAFIEQGNLVLYDVPPLKRQVFVNYHAETICADWLFCLQLFLMNCKWFPNYHCIFVCRILTLVLSHSRVVISSTFWFNLTILIVITVFSEDDVPQLIVFSLYPHLSFSPCLFSMTTWKG